jgi:rRNA maturation endonuclease Nob1
METPSQNATSPRFWCHECSTYVPTRLDETTQEMGCEVCGSTFVEEAEEVKH